MDNAWDDLPNAKHIDRVLARGRAKPAEWAAMRLAARTPEWGAAWEASWDAASGASWDAAHGISRGDIWDAVWHGSRGVGMGAVALVSWDDCAYILDLHPDAVRLLKAVGNPAAVLLLPAVIAMYEGD